jgi:hypothetical protein
MTGAAVPVSGKLVPVRWLNDDLMFEGFEVGHQWLKMTPS